MKKILLCLSLFAFASLPFKVMAVQTVDAPKSSDSSATNTDSASESSDNTDANVTENTSSEIATNSTSDDEGILVCGYGEAVNDRHTYEIRYNMDSKNFLVYANSKKKADISSFEQKLYDFADAKIIYSGKDSSNFECPDVAIEKDGYLCLAENIYQCKKYYNNFDVTNTNESGTYLKDSLVKKINSFIMKWVSSNITKTNLSDWLVKDAKNIARDIDNDLISAIKNEFFSNKDIPGFIKGSSAYLNRANVINSRLNALKGSFDSSQKSKIAEVVKNVSSVVAQNNIVIGGTLTCEDSDTSIFGSTKNPNHVAYWLQTILNIMKYVAIIALLLLSSVDFFKAFVQNDKDAMKKAGITAGKRLVFAILIFFLPVIVDVLMKLIGAYSTCGIE